MQRTIHHALFAIAFALLLAPVAASADTACVDWSCNDQTGVCSFDFSCSSASPFIWKYGLDFGDGTSTGLTGSSSVTHTYSLPTYAYPTITFTIYPWSDNGPTSVSCQITVRNYFGPPLPTSGRCTS